MFSYPFLHICFSDILGPQLHIGRSQWGILFLIIVISSSSQSKILIVILFGLKIIFLYF